MPYRYYIQRASYEESEDPRDLFFSEEEWRQALKAVSSQDASGPFSAFTLADGYATFEAEEWTAQDPIIKLALQLARELNARVFGEEDEEYC